jgi:fumarate reductase subunit D
MKVQLNIGPLLLALVSGFVALNILNGNALNYVKFAAVENELGCAVIALTMCVLSLFVTFEKITDK